MAIQFDCKTFDALQLQELYEVLCLRQAVFVVEQDCPYLDTDGRDQAAWHLLGYENGDLVAYARILPKGVSYADYPSIGRVITAQSARGKGYGVALMEQAIAFCKSKFEGQAIKISAQQYLLKFYSDLGFEPTGEEYLEDGIPHLGMIRK